MTVKLSPGAIVLGIESSCDETGVGLVRLTAPDFGRKVLDSEPFPTDVGVELLGHSLASSQELHARFGGVVPEIASRAHLEAMQPTVHGAFEAAGVGMPYGCRMGICHTCTLTLVKGSVTDVRNGDRFDQPNEQIQTCVTVPVGDCTFDI